MTSTPPSSRSDTSRRQAFIRQASAPVIDSQKPALIHRWLHALENSKGWTTFGLRDNASLETAWIKYEAEGRDTKQKTDVDTGSNATPGEKLKGSEDLKGTEKEEEFIEPPDPDTPLPVWRVPVADEKLFEVDLRKKKLWPVFWKGKGLEVLRGSWFFDASKISPCNENVAQELEMLYNTIKPWLPSYTDELKSAVNLGAEAEAKLRAPLKSLKGTYVIFLGKSLARIYSDDVTSRMTKTLWTAWSGAHGGGTLVARGFDNARRLLRTRENKRPVSKSTPRRARETSNSVHDSPTPSGSKMPQASEDFVKEGSAQPDTPTPEATPNPSSTSATLNTEGISSDMLKSFVTKLSGWGSSSSKEASRLTTRTQDDIKEAFKEAQSIGQGLNTKGGKGQMGGMASAGLEDDNQDGSDREEEEVTAEQEAKEEEEELERERQRDEEPIELVLIWHGIGQKLAEEWKSLDFTLAVSSLRALAHKRRSMAAPSDVGGGGMAALSRGRRVQFIPVLWRATLNDFEPTASDEEAKKEEHLNNKFSIDDIFSDTIPLIKQLISGILFDIPLYLSQHREEILSRVIKESNRVYRLFLQRNEKFLTNGGRTSLLAHSLGAALAVDVLSKQPTHCSAWDKLPHPGAELAFDCRNLYLAGSPVALFMWINKSQLIARKGRELTQISPVDEALERSGRWGCLAVDRIFNIFSASDPIGTRLNSTVDATYSKLLTSVPLARVTKALLRTLPDTLEAAAPSTGLFGSWGRSSAAYANATMATTNINFDMAMQRDTSADDMPDGAEALFAEKAKIAEENNDDFAKRSIALAQRAKGGFEEKWKEIKAEKERKQAEDEKRLREGKEQDLIERNRAERRMEALCELGCVDFVIPVQTSLLTNQYMEFLWSHASYWTDTSFADFLLATLFASSETLKEAKSKLPKEQ